MRRAYIEAKEYARTYEGARNLQIDAVRVEYSQDIYKDDQYAVVGHDIGTGRWYLLAPVVADKGKAWQIKEGLAGKIGEAAMMNCTGGAKP